MLLSSTPQVPAGGAAPPAERDRRCRQQLEDQHHPIHDEGAATGAPHEKCGEPATRACVNNLLWVSSRLARLLRQSVVNTAVPFCWLAGVAANHCSGVQFRPVRRWSRSVDRVEPQVGATTVAIAVRPGPSLPVRGRLLVCGRTRWTGTTHMSGLPRTPASRSRNEVVRSSILRGGSIPDLQR